MSFSTVDANIAVDALTYEGEKGVSARKVIAQNTLFVPQIFHTEVLHVIRKLVRRGEFPLSKAHNAIQRLARLPVKVVATRALLPRMWELRDTLSGYDASYAACAEHTNSTLISRDKALLTASDTLLCPVHSAL